MNSKFRCTGCREYFPAPCRLKVNRGSFHSYDCASTHGLAKAKKLKVKQEKKEHSAAKRKLNDESLSYQIKKTQDRIFNPYIRLRDRDLPCISCGRSDHEIDYTGSGGRWDCGHYKTVGAYPELRFDERNAHKQCKKCNGGSGKYSRKGRSVSEGYGTGLLERVGQETFDWLNGPHAPKRYTIENLKTIQKWFKRKTKRLERE